jgi:hypothetical protein
MTSSQQALLGFAVRLHGPPVVFVAVIVLSCCPSVGRAESEPPKPVVINSTDESAGAPGSTIVTRAIHSTFANRPVMEYTP